MKRLGIGKTALARLIALLQCHAGEQFGYLPYHNRWFSPKQYAMLKKLNRLSKTRTEQQIIQLIQENGGHLP